MPSPKREREREMNERTKEIRKKPQNNPGHFRNNTG